MDYIVIFQIMVHLMVQKCTGEYCVAENNGHLGSGIKFKESVIVIQMMQALRTHTHNRAFSEFLFKIRLIRLGFSFHKNQKLLYFNSQPTDFQSKVLSTTPQRQLPLEDTEKLSVTFSHASLILVEFT